jgi:hypothetical protein
MSLNIQATTSSSSNSAVVSPTKIQSPSKLAEWKVRVLKNGKIDPTPPAKVWEKMENKGITADVVYRVIHKDTKRRYIGSVKDTEAGNDVKKRMQTYKFRVNDSFQGKRTYIENAIRRSPSKFVFGIIQHKPGITEVELHEREASPVKHYQTLNKKYGYNQKNPLEEPERSLDSKAKRKKNLDGSVKKIRVDVTPREKSTRSCSKEATQKIARQLFSASQGESDEELSP